MARNQNIARRALAELALDRFPDDAARVLETAPVAEIVTLLEAQPAQRTADVLRRLTPDRAARLVAAFDDEATRRVLTALDPNRAANVLARLDPEERNACLAALDESLAQELRALAEYPRETAGGLMDPRITTFRPDATVRDLVRRLRTFRRRRVQDVFVVDPEGRLLGSVSMQEVVLAPSDTRLDAIMRSPTPQVGATSPREEVVAELQRHRVASLPVVDFDQRVLGVLRQDELLTAAREEATSDARHHGGRRKRRASAVATAASRSASGCPGSR